MRDSKALAEARQNQIEDCDPIPHETRDAVRRLVCGNAVGDTLAEQIADAETIMLALGIHRSQDNDVVLQTGVPMLPNAPVSR